MKCTKFFVIAVAIMSITTVFGQVKLGVDVLRENNFEPIRGKRVGLITNPTGVDSHLRSTIDILSSPAAKQAGVRLTALFAPEHGVRGDVAAGEKVDNMIDRSGAQVFSLYGNGYKPKPEMLREVDVLIFDIQDIGSRSYTFISTLGLAMEAAAENGKEFVVLDRPNPLGGLKVEGGTVENGFSSFVSKYPIPYIHGLTVGELARVYNGEKMLKGGARCNLKIVEMKGWNRDMTWEQTGLQWIPTSPHIPTPQSAVCYPVTGMAGELQTINIGVGYTLPFGVFAAEWITDAATLADRLNAKHIAGVTFREMHLNPYYGSSKGKNIHGVQIHFTDADRAPLTMLMFYVFEELYAMHPSCGLFEKAATDRISMFDKVMGSATPRTLFINSGYNAAAVKTWWNKAPAWFLPIRAKYLLY